jgi:MFS family permease
VERREKEIQKQQEYRNNAGSISSSSLASPPTQVQDNTHDPYRALRFRDFRLLFIGTFIASLGEQMVNVAIGWELYLRTGSALALGFVGLVQVLPVLVLSLPAGHLADRLNRKGIVIVTQFLLALASLGLTLLSSLHGPLVLIYACLLLIGTGVAFNNPAASTLIPQAVPEQEFESAARWSSSSWQLAAVIGPALGGFVIALDHGTALVYGLNALAALLFLQLIILFRGRQQEVPVSEGTTLSSLLEGIRFLRQAHVILAAITLDMFAVLLGGATTLLPIFAQTILHVGPTGLGWLRAAPSMGAVCVSIGLTRLPPFKHAGKTLLAAVAGFGLATIIFGLSRSFWLSLLMLFLLGGFDNISVVIRSTLLLTRTPDELRGRIASVNALFIGASNELGGFESGVAAQLFGPVIAVAGGGVGTLLVVLCVALIWPQMRRLRSLSGSRQ